MAKINVRNRNKNCPDKKPNWEYRFEAARIDGKRKHITKAGFRTKKEALEAGAAALAEYNACGIHFVPSQISVSDFFDLWIENYCKVHLKDTSAQCYQYCVNHNIKPAIGKFKLATISPAVLQTFVNKFANYSKSYINKIVGILHKAFEYAIFPLGYLKENPTIHLQIPNSPLRVIPKEKEIIDEDEFNLILEHYPLGDKYNIPIMLGWYCGLRISEALALTWDDVDFLQKTIIINKQLSQLVRQGDLPLIKLSSPKYMSTRKVILCSEMYDALVAERERQLCYHKVLDENYVTYSLNEANQVIIGGNNLDFVCRTHNGSLVSLRSLRHVMDKISDILGKRITYHCFRHSHATILLRNGINPKVIQQRLGHKQMSTTLNIYSHSDLEDQVEAMRILDKLTEV